MNKVSVKLKKALTALFACGVLIAVFSAGWWVGQPRKAGDDSSETAKGTTAWTCSMHSHIMQPDPGSCPICGMDLIPATRGDGGGDSSIVINAGRAEAMGLRVSPVRRQLASKSVSLVGQIVPDERYTNTITSRVDGRIERLFVDYTGISVKDGDHLAMIYSPDLLVAQKELIDARQRLDTAGNESEVILNNRKRLYQAAREKLRLLELNEEQILQIEAARKPSDKLTIYAPERGVVTKKYVKKGDYVKTGSPLYTVSDLRTVWVVLDAYEQDLPWLHYAQGVHFSTPAVPGKEFAGKVAFIDPVLNPKTRTSRVRVNVTNSEMLLKPGMYVKASVSAQVNAAGQVVVDGLSGKWISPMHPEIIKDKPGACDICGMPLVQIEALGIKGASEVKDLPLVVPHSAVLQTGNKAIVYKRTVDAGDIEFEATQVVLGHRVNGYYVVREGLQEGDFVVTQGAFKLDSELQINAKNSMMSMPASYLGPPVPSSPLSASELSVLKQVITIYLNISYAMAHDKHAVAVQHTQELAKELSASGVAPLRAKAQVVGKSRSVEDIKKWLDPLTLVLSNYVKRRAANQLDPLYLHHCPMALSGDGGHWLGTTHAIENPYFGSEMFACGTVKAQLTVKGQQPEGDGSGRGNQK